MTEMPDSLSLGLDIGGVVIDREAEVPIGVQLAWALRSRIASGGFKPGQRLPGLREAAEAVGVNVNTVRAVYQRLEREGLIDSQQGSGTFVAHAPRGPSDAATIAANASEESREAGVDPREVAAAVYVSASSSSEPVDASAARRRMLRKQIAVLERAIGDLEADHPGLAGPATETSTSIGPTLLSAEQLQRVRTQLLRRLGSIQGAMDEQARAVEAAASDASERKPASPRVTAKTKRAAKPRGATRPATAQT